MLSEKEGAIEQHLVSSGIYETGTVFFCVFMQKYILKMLTYEWQDVEFYPHLYNFLYCLRD